MNAKLTSGLLFLFSFCRTNFWFRHFCLFNCFFFSFLNSIIKLNQWIFEHTNQAPRNHGARVTSGCLWIRLSFRILLPVFYFNSSGFRWTSSGRMISSPSFSIAFLSNDFKALFIGVSPLNFGLDVLLI